MTLKQILKKFKIASGLFLDFPPADHQGQEWIISAFSRKSYIALAPHLLNLEIGHILVLEQFYIHLLRWHPNLQIVYIFYFWSSFIFTCWGDILTYELATVLHPGTDLDP